MWQIPSELIEKEFYVSVFFGDYREIGSWIHLISKWRLDMNRDALIEMMNWVI
jgi:hypothetical protein